MEIEKRSVPCALVVTDEFARLAHVEARSLGLEGLPIVVIPHPLGGQGPDEVQSKAREAAEEIVRVLTTPRAAIAKEARDRQYPVPKAVVWPRQVVSPGPSRV